MRSDALLLLDSRNNQGANPNGGPWMNVDIDCQYDKAVKLTGESNDYRDDDNDRDDDDDVVVALPQTLLVDPRCRSFRSSR